MTLPPRCFNGQKSTAGDTTRAQNSRRNTQTGWQLHLLPQKNEEDDAIYEDAVRYTERSEGQPFKSLFHERTINLTYLQQTTQSSTTLATRVVQNSPWQLDAVTKAHKIRPRRCLIQCGDLRYAVFACQPPHPGLQQKPLVGIILKLTLEKLQQNKYSSASSLGESQLH